VPPKAKDYRVIDICDFTGAILSKFGLIAKMIIGGRDERTNSKTSYDLESIGG
jgi:hypothetical protein